MFNVELTLGQKLQIGFVALIFAVAGFMFFRNTRPPADMTINSWSKQFNDVGLNPKLVVSAKNPPDLTKSRFVTFFECHDGELRITEFTHESGLRAQFSFVPDHHRTSYDFWQDPMAKVNTISDPYKHTLTFAAYSAAENRPQQRLVFRADLDDQQKKTEKDARQAMLDAVTLMEEGSKTGTFHPEMYEKVIAALEAYRKTPGDPIKDPAKAKAAHVVVDLAMAYLTRLQSDKAAAIQKYISSMDSMLKDDQKLKLGEAAKLLANRPRFVKTRAG